MRAVGEGQALHTGKGKAYKLTVEPADAEMETLSLRGSMELEKANTGGP